MTPSQQLVTRLVDDFPTLGRLMAEHLADQDGELLPYLLLPDITRWAQSSMSSEPAEVGEVVDWFEREFTHAEAAEQDLIGLGFVESIPLPPEGAALLARLGPALTRVAADLGLLPPG